ncbi:MAG: 3-deoxy-manno-octulosonate cytidylyltransferase [Gammaproteobacteria bacterium 28-57-27]|nr:MAG: 3-deoxy-manno-octulosonate cytidylyltransferase [Gammaproteobacteria bacterium 28-57-27]
MTNQASYKLVIPARYASTRLPGKPLLEIEGKPLVQHVLEAARHAQAEEIVLATDDARIAEVGERLDVRVVMTSPEHSTGTDRLAEVVQIMGWADDAIVVNLQGDEPLIPPALLDRLAANLLHYPQAGIATLCTPIHHARDMFDPHVVKVVRDRSGLALYFSRAPIPWERDRFGVEEGAAHEHGFRHLGLYAYRAGFLRDFATWPEAPIEGLEKLEQLRALWHGVRIHVDVVDEPPGHGVDTQDDLLRVAALLREQYP